MALVLKSFCQTTLPQTNAGDLYSPVGEGKAQIVRSIRLVNTGAAATVNLYLKHGSGGSDIQISPVNLSLAAGACFVDDTEIVLVGGPEASADRIRGSASTNQVHCVISGVERDQS